MNELILGWETFFFLVILPVRFSLFGLKRTYHTNKLKHSKIYFDYTETRKTHMNLTSATNEKQKHDKNNRLIPTPKWKQSEREEKRKPT